MRHFRADYEAIQAWPTKRPHIAKQDGQTIRVEPEPGSWGEIDAEAQLQAGNFTPIIPEDEPVFLLRATDASAPALVRQWATMLDATQPHPAHSEYDHEKAELVERVKAWADEMEAYAAAHYDGGRVPDTPKEYLLP